MLETEKKQLQQLLEAPRQNDAEDEAIRDAVFEEPAPSEDFAEVHSTSELHDKSAGESKEAHQAPVQPAGGEWTDAPDAHETEKKQLQDEDRRVLNAPIARPEPHVPARDAALHEATEETPEAKPVSPRSPGRETEDAQKEATNSAHSVTENHRESIDVFHHE